MFTTQLAAGVTRASIFFLLASGLTLVFGVVRLINFAHGSLYMLGMYLTYTFASILFNQSPFGFWLSLLLAPLCVAIIGGVIEVTLLRRVYEQRIGYGMAQHLMQLLLTFALIYIFSDIFRIFWGVLMKPVSRAGQLSGYIIIAKGIVPTYNLFVIIVAVGVAVILWVVLNKTRFGRVTRAAANDPDMTGALGVKVDTVFTGIFVMGAFLAGFAGSISAPLGGATLGVDVEMAVLAFIIVIIGGVGSISGAALAALIVGIIEAFGIMYLPRFVLVFIYAVMVGVLMVRPYGLFGKEVR